MTRADARDLLMLPPITASALFLTLDHPTQTLEALKIDAINGAVVLVP
jgi:hypothetical protein